MEDFSLEDCEIFWNKEVRISRGHKQAIKEELKSMWPKIRNALKFTGKNQGSFVTFELEPKTRKPEWIYGLYVFSGIDDAEQKYWRILVQGGESAQKFNELAYVNSDKFNIYSAEASELIQRDRF
jgi:hypothetical protein